MANSGEEKKKNGSGRYIFGADISVGAQNDCSGNCGTCESCKNEGNEGEIEGELMKKDGFSLCSPWELYAKKLTALFQHDPDVKIVLENDLYTIKVLVHGEKKAEALDILLPHRRILGGIEIKILVIPDNEERVNDIESLFNAAFEGNKAFTGIKYGSGLRSGNLYVMFKPEVVQYYSDNIGDYNMISSTLYQNIANEVFDCDKILGTFFCTDLAGVDEE